MLTDWQSGEEVKRSGSSDWHVEEKIKRRRKIRRWGLNDLLGAIKGLEDEAKGCAGTRQRDLSPLKLKMREGGVEGEVREKIRRLKKQKDQRGIGC